MNFLGHYYLHTGAFWVIRGGLTSLFCAVRLWWAIPRSTIHFSFCLLSLFLSCPGSVWIGMPVTLGEEHSPCMKILSLLNADSKMCNEFWFTWGIWAQMWWFSLHMSCWYPQLEFCWQQSAKMLYKSVSSSLPCLFPNLLCWWKREYMAMKPQIKKAAN